MTILIEIAEIYEIRDKISRSSALYNVIGLVCKSGRQVLANIATVAGSKDFCSM